MKRALCGCAWSLVLSLLMPSGAMAADAPPAQPRIRNIEINFAGVASVTEEIVRANIAAREGMVFEPNMIDRDIRSLYNTQYFELVEVRRVDVSPTEVDLIYDLRPRPRIGAIRYEGNEKISSRRLENQVTINNNFALNERQVKEDADKIAEYYREQGFSQVRVEWDVERNPLTGFATVVFSIDEGNKVRISNVEFVGNDSFRDSTLRRQMEVRKWWIFSFITGSGKFDDEQFAEDLDAVLDFYRNRGFLDVEIDPSAVTFAYPTPKTMTITIPVQEGRQYRIGEISITGNSLFPTPVLLNYVAIRPGDVFDPEDLSEDAGRLEDFYGQFGYLETRAALVRRPNIATGAIDIEFNIRESEQFTVESINIEGNTKTKSIVVLRELLLAPGDVFDQVRMETSRVRLENTRFFENVNVHAESTNIPNRKNLSISFREAPTGQLQFGAGFSSLEKAVFFVEVSQSNFDLFNRRSFFQGDGQKFRLKAQVGELSNQIVLAFEEPYLFEQLLGFGFQIYRQESEFTSSIYSELRQGFEVFIRRHLIERIEARLAYRLETIDIFDVSPSAGPIISSLAGKTDVSKLSLLLLRDTRDSLITPTAGARFEGIIEYAGGLLGGDTNYYRLEGRAVQYFPLFEFQRQTIEVAGRIGVLKEFGDSTDVPFYDRFFLGGQNDMRGFEFREVGPKEDQFREPIGGKSYAFFSLEYSIDIAQPMRFAIFYDAGFVNRGSFDFNPSGFNDNIGVGIRFFVLGNPMRLDYGIPLTTDGFNDEGAQFNFAFGSRF